MKNIEILAPVGSMEALFAAVENGANAVYLGGKLFNARQYASNFDNEQLEEAVRYAHLNNVRVYITLNILLEDNELKEVVDYLLFLYNIDVDAVIVQDLGLVRLIKELLPDFEIHGSTQMTVNNYMGAKFLEDLGFDRVVLARELSIDEIRYIKDNSNIELEGFIHGALCVSYSGQCLMSSMIGGRSGNRGRCAQPCRMPYTLVNFENSSRINEKFTGKYILSPKDLNTIDHLDKIVFTGITSLKIEGRMKRPEYVAIIVDKYKKTLDSISGNSEYSITEKDKKDITQIFNRGFTKGHILKDDFNNFISFDKPNNRGLFIGKVISVNKKYISITLEDSIRKGDGIEITNKLGESTGLVVNKLYLEGKLVEYIHKGKIAQINLIKGVQVDSNVMKTSDVDLLKRAKSTYAKKDNYTKIGIYMGLDISIGENARLHIWDEEGNYVESISEELVEKGRNISLTKEKIKKQMEKLGNTPYFLKGIEINLLEGSIISTSVLNRLRRDVVEQLNKKRGNFNNRREIKKIEIEDKIFRLFSQPSDTEVRDRKISVKVNTKEQFKQLDLSKLDRVYLNFTDGVEKSIIKAKENNKETYFSTGKIIDNMGLKKLKKLIDNIGVSRLDGISVSNLGSLKFVKDNYDTKIHCDIGLNIFNSSTIKLLKDYGVESVTLSPELKLSQIKQITKNIDVACESIGFGYLPLMIMKYCPLSLVRKCTSESDCNKCNLKSGYGLLDRKGMKFNMTRKDDTTIIYNSLPIMIVEHLKKIFNNDVDIIRLDFTIEKEGIRDIQDIYYNFANDKVGIDQVKEFVESFKRTTGLTKGHYFRGVL